MVDFGSGAGNATLAIAWLLRARCSFVLLDMKPVAVELATERIAGVPGLSDTASANDSTRDFSVLVNLTAILVPIRVSHLLSTTCLMAQNLR